MADATKNPSELPPPPSTAATTTTATTKASLRHKTTSASNSRTSPLSSHLQMIELKNRILTSLNKLSDRDTHQIAVDELDKISQTLAPDSIPMFLNCLYDAAESQQKPIVRKQSIKLLAGLSLFHLEPLSSYLPKIITHIVKRLKDPDSSVREACQSAVSVLAEQYLKDGERNNGGLVVGLMVKPFLEALGEQNKTVQAGSAMCLGRLVESSSDPPILAFQKLCPRVCKFLGSPNFLAKAALLSLVSSLAQVGAIAPQSMQVLLQCIHECLESSDWSTRKAAAEALCQIASHSSHQIGDGGISTITALEACRFDKVKPVRDSMNEALQLWKNVAGKEGDGNSEETKSVSHENKNTENGPLEKLESLKSSPSGRRLETGTKDPSKASTSAADSPSKVQSSTISDKTVGLLKKKPPILNDKELNPEFFQKLESRGPGDLPVEVVLPRRHPQSFQSQTEEGSEAVSDVTIISGSDSMVTHGDTLEITTADRRVEAYNRTHVDEDGARDRWLEQRSFRGKERAMDCNDKVENIQRDLSNSRIGYSRGDGQTDNSIGKGNWLGIQRQLMQLERQQASIMNMLQEFMGGSHDSMVTLENRVRGLERVVEDMARDLALASNRRGSNMMFGFEGSSVRPLSKYNGCADYAGGKLGRNADGRIFSDRFPSDGNVLGARGRDLSWRSDGTDTWDSYSCGSPRTALSSRRAVNGATNDGRLPRNDIDLVGSRRGWDKGPGPVRLGEGPSARSVWQASKDEATLEAIRVAGEDNGVSRTKSRTTVPDPTGESLSSDSAGQEGGPFWTTWTRALNSLHAGDVDSAYADILSTGDDLFLVKLMDRSGPVMDQLSNKIAGKVLDAVAQFLQEPSLLDMGLSWTQQLVDLLVDNGAEFVSISLESKKALLVGLYEASRMEPPDDWEGVPADELMMQLATIWEIELQQFRK
ncbi:unnamed protein product [Victoria cruziana]